MKFKLKIFIVGLFLSALFISNAFAESDAQYWHSYQLKWEFAKDTLFRV